MISYALYALFVLPCVLGGSVRVENKPQVRVTTSFANFGARIMDQWGGGGGTYWTISNDSHHPFIGRDFGGAGRGDIRGSTAFGSGYHPSRVRNANASSVAGRDFPFGVWPLWWEDDFMGSKEEYGPQLDAIRPGGHLSVVALIPDKRSWHTTDDNVYYAIGDAQSILAVLVSYMTWCHVEPAWPTRFDLQAYNETMIKMENVLRYYRASSFALASPSFTNTQARNPLEDSHHIPESIEESAFWTCLDSVTANALPILNKTPWNLDRWREWLPYTAVLMPIAGIVSFSIVMVACAHVRDWIWNWEQTKMDFKNWSERLSQGAALAAEREAREAAIAYERFP